MRSKNLNTVSFFVFQANQHKLGVIVDSER